MSSACTAASGIRKEVSVRDEMIFLTNPYLAGLRLASPEPLSPSLPAVNVQPRVAPPRALGPVAPTTEDDGFRPLPAADARMFLGRNYDPARTYRRNRLTGEIEPMGVLPAADDIEQTTETGERSPSPLSDRERLLRPGRGEQNYSPWNREQELPSGPPPSSGGGRIDSPVPPRSVGRQVLDGVGDAVSAVGDAASTFNDWFETRGNRAFGNAAGLPRTVVENSGVGQVVPSMMPYARKYLPTADEATNFIRRNGGIFPVRGRKLLLTNGADAPVPPETNLPGLWGKTVDGVVEGVLGAALTRTPPNRLPLMMGAFTGGGSALAREIARRYAQREDGPRPQQSPYGFGDLFNRLWR